MEILATIFIASFMYQLNQKIEDYYHKDEYQIFNDTSF